MLLQIYVLIAERLASITLCIYPVMPFPSKHLNTIPHVSNKQISKANRSNFPEKTHLLDEAAINSNSANRRQGQ